MVCPIMRKHAMAEDLRKSMKAEELAVSQRVIGVTSPFRSSYEKGCQGKKHLPAPLGDAGVVTYIQPHLIPHLILRGVIGLVALARRTFPRRCQPQLLVPIRRFHEVSGARRRSVPKLRKLSVGLRANHPMKKDVKEKSISPPL